ncbi:MAG: hypothetical protein COA79_21150 [Planctomycetota bacterium]|nr:MAG: hypothetical protein COA79_21150 [Planctomycetota bacterium]
MKTDLQTLRQVSEKLNQAPHVIDYVYVSRKLPSPLILSGMRLFTKEDIEALSDFFDTRNTEKESNKIHQKGG